MMRYVSPLRYPGGKARLSEFIGYLLAQNRLLDAHYVEPCAGGASVGLSLLVSEHISHAHINDIDRGVYAFWHSVLHETDALCRRIGNAPVTMSEWRRQRAVHARQGSVGLLDLGFATLFLNRTNRSGIINSGGPIGGTRQKGKWKLDARFGRDGLVERIRTIAAYRTRISLYNRDAVEFLAEITPTLPRRSFIYLDPPYYVKGGRRLYTNGYAHEDHLAVAALLARRTRWMVTYDDVAAIRSIYRGYRSIRYRLSYSAGVRSSGAEIAFFASGLELPRGKRPVWT